MNLLIRSRVFTACIEARAGQWMQMFAPAPEQLRVAPPSFPATPEALPLLAPLTCYYFNYGGQ